jgi:hypothetical protein
MKCRGCGFRSLIVFWKCPVCGALSNKGYLIIQFMKIFSWISDRRICLISKRQKIDRSLFVTHLLPPNCRGVNRIWWEYRLLDLIPIWIVQDSTSVFIFDAPRPPPLPPIEGTGNTEIRS